LGEICNRGTLLALALVTLPLLSEITLPPKSKSLAWTRTRAEDTKFSLRTRLGESLSPEQDSVSLKTRALRLGELLEQNLGESQPFSPRRDELTWARIIVLATVTRMQQELKLNSNIPKLKQASSYYPKHQSSIKSWYRPKTCKNSS